MTICVGSSIWCAMLFWKKQNVIMWDDSTTSYAKWWLSGYPIPHEIQSQVCMMTLYGTWCLDDGARLHENGLVYRLTPYDIQSPVHRATLSCKCANTLWCTMLSWQSDITWYTMSWKWGKIAWHIVPIRTVTTCHMVLLFTVVQMKW